jgi:hypothetical protein
MEAIEAKTRELIATWEESANQQQVICSSPSQMPYHVLSCHHIEVMG